MNENTSEIGLAPWYAGLWRGFPDFAASRFWYGIAVSDSKLWQSTSNPVEAVIAGGRVWVFSESMMPRVGLRLRWEMPVLVLEETMSKIAVPVVSAPVPAVVGMQIRGLRGLSMGRPLPRGALTKSIRSASG